MKYVKTPRGLTLVFNGERPVHVPSGAPRFSEIEAAVVAGREELARILLEENRVGLNEALTTDARLRYDRGSLWWAGSSNAVAVPGGFSTAFIRAALGGYGLHGLVRLLESCGDDTTKVELLSSLGARLDVQGNLYARAGLGDEPDGGDVALYPDSSSEGVPALITASTVRRVRGELRGFARPINVAQCYLSPVPGNALAAHSARLDVQAFDGRKWVTLSQDVPFFVGMDAAEAALATNSEARAYLSGTDYVVWAGANKAAAVEVWSSESSSDEGTCLGYFSSLPVARQLLASKLDGDDGAWLEIRRNGNVLVRKEF